MLLYIRNYILFPIHFLKFEVLIRTRRFADRRLR